jgi:hypothetical protein
MKTKKNDRVKKVDFSSLNILEKMKFFLRKPREFADSIKNETLGEIVRIYLFVSFVFSFFLSVLVNGVLNFGNFLGTAFVSGTIISTIAILLMAIIGNTVFGLIIHGATRLVSGRNTVRESMKIFLVYSATSHAIIMAFMISTAVIYGILMIGAMVLGPAIGLILILALLAVIIGGFGLALLNIISFVRAISQSHGISSLRSFAACLIAYFALQIVSSVLLLPLMLAGFLGG